MKIQICNFLFCPHTRRDLGQSIKLRILFPKGPSPRLQRETKLYIRTAKNMQPNILILTLLDMRQNILNGGKQFLHLTV